MIKSGKKQLKSSPPPSKMAVQTNSTQDISKAVQEFYGERTSDSEHALCSDAMMEFLMQSTPDRVMESISAGCAYHNIWTPEVMNEVHDKLDAAHRSSPSSVAPFYATLKKSLTGSGGTRAHARCLGNHVFRLATDSYQSRTSNPSVNADHQKVQEKQRARDAQEMRKKEEELRKHEESEKQRIVDERKRLAELKKMHAEQLKELGEGVGVGSDKGKQPRPGVPPKFAGGEGGAGTARPKLSPVADMGDSMGSLGVDGMGSMGVDGMGSMGVDGMGSMGVDGMGSMGVGGMGSMGSNKLPGGRQLANSPPAKRPPVANSPPAATSAAAAARNSPPPLCDQGQQKQQQSEIPASIPVAATSAPTCYHCYHCC